MRIAAAGIAMPGIFTPTIAASQTFSPGFTARSSSFGARGSRSHPKTGTDATSGKQTTVGPMVGGGARVNLRKLLNLKTPRKDQIRIRLPKP